MKYDHLVSFRVTADGSQFIMASYTFDEKGNLSYKITQTSDPISQETMEAFFEFMKIVQKINTQFKGAPTIYIGKKEFFAAEVSVDSDKIELTLAERKEKEAVKPK